ncbi:MAG: hypothetical protein HYS35_05450 [Betaproteobacteria bacterium]|nr:hypothetical protein [Betaproteobacteria bacterium]
MAKHDLVTRAVLALAMMLAVGSVEAGKRMPVRTQPIPDTESGRPAASAESPTFKGRLLIYGPPSLPVSAPPEHVKPAPEAAPVAAPVPAPAPAVAAPTPAPVITPIAPVAPPVAAPIPAPAPAPVAAPAPVVEPAPPPAPVAAPAAAPAPAPAAAIAAPAPMREPIVRPEIVVRPDPVRAAPAAAPAATQRQAVAAVAPSSAAAPSAGAPVPIEMKLIESIFTCLAPGLPQDWKKAWIEITDLGDGKEKVSKFFFTNLRGDEGGEPLVPCNARELTRRVVGLNEKLPPDRRAWTRALLVIDSEGDYELSYEYPK